jgi:hypothetical protein
VATPVSRTNQLLAALSRKREELAELVTNPASASLSDVVDRRHERQAAFIEDPATLKVVICTRRSGKSLGAGLYLLKEAQENPGVSVLYVGLTRQTAKRIMWKDVFKALDKRFPGVIAKYNETELAITLHNGSIIYLLGMDASEEEMEKALGQKFKLVVIDEAASYTIDLNSLVYGVLKPAVADYRGTICLIGTPSGIKRGLYYSLTAGQNPGDPGRWEVNGWSGHRWSAADNPYIRDNWLAEIEDLRRANPRIVETPLFKRNYLGQWTNDDSNLVYKFDPERNTFDGKLPEYEQGSWHYVLGIDLGWKDPTSFTVLAYHDFDQVTYILESWKKSSLTLTQVAGHAHDLNDTYNFESMIVDGANPQSVETMRRDYDLPLENAKKAIGSMRAKADFIEIQNDAFILGKIKIDPSRCAALIDEYEQLIWDAVPVVNEKGDTEWVSKKGHLRQEHPGCENHCADGAAYGFRRVYATLSEDYRPTPKRGTQEWRERQMEALEEAACKEIADARREREESEGMLWT